MKYYVVSLLKVDNSYVEKYTELRELRNVTDLEEALKISDNMYSSLSCIEKDHLISFDLTYIDDDNYTIEDLLKDGYEPLKEYIPLRH